MKIFIIRPYDYTEERTPKDSPWKSEYSDYNGQLFIRADNERDARQLASLEDKGKALNIIKANVRRDSPLTRATEDYLGVEVEILQICPYLDPVYTDCIEITINSNGVLQGDLYMAVHY